MSGNEAPEIKPEAGKTEDKAEVKPEKPEDKPKVKPVEPKPEEVGYVSLRRFAKIFDVSKGTAIRWIKHGLIKGFRTYTGQWRIPKTEIAKVAEEFKTQPTPERPPHLKPKREKKEDKHDRGKKEEWIF